MFVSPCFSVSKSAQNFASSLNNPAVGRDFSAPKLPLPDASFSKTKNTRIRSKPSSPKKTLTPGRDFLTGPRDYRRCFLLLLI